MRRKKKKKEGETYRRPHFPSPSMRAIVLRILAHFPRRILFHKSKRKRLLYPYVRLINYVRLRASVVLSPNRLAVGTCKKVSRRIVVKRCFYSKYKNLRYIRIRRSRSTRVERYTFLVELFLCNLCNFLFVIFVVRAYFTKWGKKNFIVDRTANKIYTNTSQRSPGTPHARKKERNVTLHAIYT